MKAPKEAHCVVWWCRCRCHHRSEHHVVSVIRSKHQSMLWCCVNRETRIFFHSSFLSIFVVSTWDDRASFWHSLTNPNPRIGICFCVSVSGVRTRFVILFTVVDGGVSVKSRNRIHHNARVTIFNFRWETPSQKIAFTVRHAYNKIGSYPMSERAPHDLLPTYVTY